MFPGDRVTRLYLWVIKYSLGTWSPPWWTCSSFLSVFQCEMWRNKEISAVFCFKLQPYDFQVGDATKALEATNGTTLERNGQILRVAYAKSILGPGSSQSSSLAAAAIEAATFAQQVSLKIILYVFYICFVDLYDTSYIYKLYINCKHLNNKYNIFRSHDY